MKKVIISILLILGFAYLCYIIFGLGFQRIKIPLKKEETEVLSSAKRVFNNPNISFDNTILEETSGINQTYYVIIKTYEDTMSFESFIKKSNIVSDKLCRILKYEGKYQYVSVQLYITESITEDGHLEYEKLHTKYEQEYLI